MAHSFDAVVRSPATVAQVHRAFGSQDYWLARFAEFGIAATLETLSVDGDGAVRVRIVQDLRHGALPRPVAAVYPADLKLVNDETWTPTGDGTVLGTIDIDVLGAPGAGSGSAVLTAQGSGSQLRFTGTVRFGVPLVGGRIERQLARLFGDQIPGIQRFTTRWIAAQGDPPDA